MRNLLHGSRRSGASSRSPLRDLAAVLVARGLRVREEYDELVLHASDSELRLTLAEGAHGHRVRCAISANEDRLRTSAVDLLNDLALEGHPIVAIGAGRSQVTLEFEWQHTLGTEWRVSGERVDYLMERVGGELIPRPSRSRTWIQRRRLDLPSFLPGMLGAPNTA